MTINTSSLPSGQPVSVRWIKVGPNWTFTDIGSHDALTVNPSEPGQYYGVAWANDPSIPDYQNFGFRQGGYRRTNAPEGQAQYVHEPGGVVSTFQLFTV